MCTPTNVYIVISLPNPLFSASKIRTKVGLSWWFRRSNTKYHLIVTLAKWMTTLPVNWLIVMFADWPVMMLCDWLIMSCNDWLMWSLLTVLLCFYRGTCWLVESVADLLVDPFWLKRNCTCWSMSNIAVFLLNRWKFITTTK